MGQKVKLIISYDGSSYHGWQRQPQHNSIQSELEQALFKLTQRKTSVTGAGRTDAKVHARGQVAHTTLTKEIPLLNLQNALNRFLPSSIRIENALHVPSTFHSRFDAKQKTYSYHIHTHKVLSPFKKKYAYHVKYSLDIMLMQSGAEHFIGTHNFKSFAHHCNKGSAESSPIKTIYSINISKLSNSIIIFITASGFLYKMCRNIVGTLVDVGRGKLSPSQITTILQQRNRIYARTTAPPQGLFLENIVY